MSNVWARHTNKIKPNTRFKAHSNIFTTQMQWNTTKSMSISLTKKMLRIQNAIPYRGHFISLSPSIIHIKYATANSIILVWPTKQPLILFVLPGDPERRCRRNSEIISICMRFDADLPCSERWTFFFALSVVYFSFYWWTKLEWQRYLLVFYCAHCYN